MTVYILCPHGIRTGGPEALHQLSDALIHHGFDARMVYYDWGQVVAMERADIDDGYAFGERSNEIAEYARYETKAASVVPNEPGAIVVLTETLCHLAPKFDRARVLIWWLSVDNGFEALAKINLNHLRRSGVFHASQSVYANRIIVGLGLSPAAGAFLTDYTSDLGGYSSPTPFNERPRLALFGTRKSIVNFDDVFARVREMDDTITCKKLGEMSRSQVMDLLGLARVYVETGSMPGKDRMPREALARGCNLVLAPHGAGATDFNPAMVEAALDEIPERVVYRMNAPQMQRPLWNERAQFFREVRAVFSDL